MSELITVKEVCGLLKIKSHETLDRLVREGHLPKPIKWGRFKRFDKAEVLRRLENATAN